MSYAVSCGDGRHRAEREAAPAHVALHVVPAVRRSPARLVGRLVVNILVAVSLLAFLLIALGPHLFGYRTQTMLTGSMAPGINPGDVVVSWPKPATDLKVGDVISYHIPVEDHRVETHRVVKIMHGKDGSISIRTQGDANDGADPWKATLVEDQVWVTRFVIPEVGNAIRFFRQPAFQHGVFWAGFVGLILLGLTRIWGRPAVEMAPAGALAISLEDEAAEEPGEDPIAAAAAEAEARDRAARRATAAARAAAGAMADAAFEASPRRTGVAATAARAAHAATASTPATEDDSTDTGTEDGASKEARSA